MLPDSTESAKELSELTTQQLPENKPDGVKLLFKEKFFSLANNANIYDEKDNIVYTAKGHLFSLRYNFKIYDKNDMYVGEVREKLLTLLPKVRVYEGEQLIGSISKKFSILHPKFDIDYLGWSVRGDFLSWDYTIVDADGNLVATVCKKLLHLTETYSIDIVHKKDTLNVVLFVVALAIEAYRDRQHRRNGHH